MLSKVHSGAVYGVDAYPVEIEVNAGGGDPQTVSVGLPDALRLCSGQAAVKESPSTALRVFDKDRVHTPIVNSRLRSEAMPWHAGFEMPERRLTVNLAPADIKKEGLRFNLPIAMAMYEAKRAVLLGSLDMT
jgi:magnesium chelatase family protein